MNPITNIKNQNKLNEKELQLGIAGQESKSWHQIYKKSAWVYVGGLAYELTEGDVISVFSQYGELMNINMPRDKKTGKSKGFAFLCYQDQRSTVLAVDNFNGSKVCGRMLRVDHVEEYKVPKYSEDADEETKRLWEKGCAPEPIKRRGPTEEEIRLMKEREERELARIVPLREDEEVQLLRKKRKEDRKKEKKEKKKAKKNEKKLKKLMKKAKEDPDGNWKEQIKLMDVAALKDEDVYGINEHFNFGKFEAKESSQYMARPDFQKDDWRDIEVWKLVREREKAEQAGKKNYFTQPEDYVAGRHK